MKSRVLGLALPLRLSTTSRMPSMPCIPSSSSVVNASSMPLDAKSKLSASARSDSASISSGSLEMGSRRCPPLIRRDLWNVGGSLGFETRDLDHLGPLLDLFGDELVEVGGRTGQRSATQAGELCSHFGVGEARVDFLGQFANNFCWRAHRCANADPVARLVSRQEFSNCRNIRQCCGAHGG